MHIPTDGEVVEVVQVDIPTDDVLVAAALRSLGGAADDPIDEVRLCFQLRKRRRWLTGGRVCAG